MFQRRNDCITLGTFGPPPLRIPVHLPVADLSNHLQISGTTNSGKSRLLAHIALSLIAQGEGVTLLDPHGDAARLVMTHLVNRGIYRDRQAFARITYLDLPAAAAVGRYLPFNILAQPCDTPTTARLVLEALKRAWPALDNGVAPAFENAVLSGISLLRQHGLPIVLLHDLLTDGEWRAELLRAMSDETVRGFFARLAGWGSREQALYLESTLRRAFLLAFSPVLRYSLGQQANLLGSFRERMDRGASLIVNLALPDPDARRLLGSLLTVFAEQGALQRADTPAGERGRAHTLMLDEAPSLISQSGTALQHILEQCRKFGLGLVMAAQGEGAFSERMQAALANVGTAIVFRLGRDDAEAMARRIATVHPDAIKHAGGERAVHPLYMPLIEQWEAWTAAIQHLRPRQLFVTRMPPRNLLLRRFTPRVAKLRTPDLPDPVVDVDALAAVEDHYLTHCFTVQPIVAEELKQLHPMPQGTITQRRTRITR